MSSLLLFQAHKVRIGAFSNKLVESRPAVLIAARTWIFSSNKN